MILDNKNSEENKVAKAGAIYTFGNYLLKGLGFITIPIFSRLLDTTDFGIYNAFLSYEGILYLFVGLALHSSIKNAKYKFGDENLDRYTSSITIIPLVSSIIFLIAGNLLLPVIHDALNVDRAQLNLLIIMSLCSSVLYIYQSRLVIDYRTKEYLKISYFNAITSILFSISLIMFVFPNRKYFGRILGTVLPMVLIAIWILYKVYKKSLPNVNWKYWKYGLKIGVPIIPHGVGQVVLTSFDRIMILNMIGASEAGLYSFAYTIYSIILVAGNSISTVLEPWAYEKLAAGDKRSLQRRSSQFILGLAVLCGGTMLIAPELVLILGSKKYLGAIPAVTPVLLGGFFAMAYTMPSIIEYYKEKTIHIAIGTGMAAIINIVLNAIFIPRYGYVAAAYTTLISYFCYYLYHSLISYRIIGFSMVPMKVNLAAVVLLLSTSLVAVKFSDSILARYSMGALILLAVGCFAWKNYKTYKSKKNNA